MELSDNKLNLLERMNLKYYGFKKTLSKIHTFGKTKISLLFIPHSNENIIKVEISHYLLAFLSFICVSLLSLGVSFLGYYLFTRNDHLDLYARGNKEKIFFLQIYIEIIKNFWKMVTGNFLLLMMILTKF